MLLHECRAKSIWCIDVGYVEMWISSVQSTQVLHLKVSSLSAVHKKNKSIICHNEEKVSFCMSGVTFSTMRNWDVITDFSFHCIVMQGRENNTSV